MRKNIDDIVGDILEGRAGILHSSADSAFLAILDIINLEPVGLLDQEYWCVVPIDGSRLIDSSNQSRPGMKYHHSETLFNELMKSDYGVFNHKERESEKVTTNNGKMRDTVKKFRLDKKKRLLEVEGELLRKREEILRLKEGLKDQKREIKRLEALSKELQ